MALGTTQMKAYGFPYSLIFDTSPVSLENRHTDHQNDTVLEGIDMLSVCMHYDGGHLSL